jgi:hypothetical protein
MRISEIILELNNANQFLIGPDSLFYGKRMLTSGAEELIVEEASIASSNDQIHLKIYFRENEISRKDEISAAIHNHFSYRRKKSQRQLRKILHLGWRSLFVSILFFGLLASLSYAIIQLLPDGRFFVTFHELLIIFGWVALWRPADLLLYDWRPFSREVKLFRKLEQCKVEIMP